MGAKLLPVNVVLRHRGAEDALGHTLELGRLEGLPRGKQVASKRRQAAPRRGPKFEKEKTNQGALKFRGPNWGLFLYQRVRH